MAAEDHLSNQQFYDEPNGSRYHLSTGGWNSVMAHKVKPQGMSKPADEMHPDDYRSKGDLSVKPVGGLTYFDNNLGAANKPDQPTVFKAIVNPPHRRKGLASAMFDFADQHAQAKYGKPLQHSSALSDDGKAFVVGHTIKKLTKGG